MSLSIWVSMEEKRSFQGSLMTLGEMEGGTARLETDLDAA